MLFGYFMLLIAVGISSIAAYYSVAGLTAIFAAATLPVIIMGGALEAGKIAATVWLHNNWTRAGVAFKLYLIPAIMFLMLLTSMGIFGFLSKAHLDQNIPTGDAQAQVQLLDEKIATARGNIESAKSTLKQMDAQVNEMLTRSSNNKGTERAVTLRKQQEKERASLNKIVTDNQTSIAALNAERAPIAAAYRKIEAEVGPIKYVAALLYDNAADGDSLERAVRWVIILIVVVFDPLALCLILAANKQLEWARQGRGNWIHDEHEDKPTVPVEEEKISNPSTGELPPQETPLTEEQREAEEDRKLKEHFWRGRMIARALDEDRRMVDAGNAALADIVPDPQDVTLVLEDLAAYKAEEQRLLKEAADQQKMLEDLAQEFNTLDQRLKDAREKELELSAKLVAAEVAKEGLQAHAQQRENDLREKLESAKLSNTIIDGQLNMVLDDKDALTEHSRLLEQQLEQSTQEVSKLTVELEEQTSEVTKLTQWVQQLQSDLRAAIELAVERNEKITELTATPPVEEVIVPVLDKTEITTATESPEDANDGRGYQEKYFAKYTPPSDFVDDEVPESGRADFGTTFPPNPSKGDLFLRVDSLPPQLYKWNSSKWIELDRATTDRFAYDAAYIEHLINKLRTGEYELDDLSETERAEVTSYLNGRPV